MPRVRIFQVAYDPSLLRVRAEMLKHAGFEVWSAMGNDEACRVLAESAEYELLLVGWSASDAVRSNAVRSNMVQWVKQRWPALPVIALYSRTGHAIPQAEFNSCSENPAEWFTAVKRAAAS